MKLERNPLHRALPCSSDAGDDEAWPYYRYELSVFALSDADEGEQAALAECAIES